VDISNFLETILWIGLTGTIFLGIIYALHRWLRPPPNPSKLTTQLYAGGERVKEGERRYLERTFIFVAYFSILDFIGFLIGTVFIRVVIGESILTSSIAALLLVLILTVFILVRSRWPLDSEIQDIVIHQVKSSGD
jgi:hypothetical protein